MARTRGATPVRKASRSGASHSLCTVKCFSRGATMVCFGASARTSALSPAIAFLPLVERRGVEKHRIALPRRAPPVSYSEFRVSKSRPCRLSSALRSVDPAATIPVRPREDGHRPAGAAAWRLSHGVGGDMASVLLRDVRKAFGTAEIIHGVDITIDDGEFVALVGPSGCGKSTLLRMIAGLENITSGEIRIGDRVVNRVPPKERDVAMVFQNYALYPHMTVADNMSFSLMLRGAAKGEIEQRVNGAADILGLRSLLNRYPRQLSGGQRQR